MLRTVLWSLLITVRGTMQLLNSATKITVQIKRHTYSRRQQFCNRTTIKWILLSAFI